MEGLYVPTGMLGKKLAAAVVSPLPVTAFQAFQIVQDARVVLTGGITLSRISGIDPPNKSLCYLQ